MYISFEQLIFLLLLAFILFGPEKLPEYAEKLGRLVAKLRQASQEATQQVKNPFTYPSPPPPPPPIQPAQIAKPSYCPQCYKSLESAFTFCPYCGENLKEPPGSKETAAKAKRPRRPRAKPAAADAGAAKAPRKPRTKPAAATPAKTSSDDPASR